MGHEQDEDPVSEDQGIGLDAAGLAGALALCLCVQLAQGSEGDSLLSAVSGGLGYGHQASELNIGERCHLTCKVCKLHRADSGFTRL